MIETFIDADIPVLVWGPPGTGKTSAIMAMARARGAHVEVIIGSTMDPTDLGYLMYSEGRLSRVPPEWATRLHAAVQAGRPAWLFLDELSCAPPGVQAALLRLTQERHVGDLSLAGIRVIAAANPADQAAGGFDLAPATHNRWAHIDWEVDVSAWCVGMLDGWGSAPAPEELPARREIVTWIRHKPSMLCAPHATDRAWPSPRSWLALARAWARLPNRQSQASGEVASALVGTGAASEILAFLASQDVPDPETLLASGRLPKPLRADIQAAVLDAIVVAACSEHEDLRTRYAVAWQLLDQARTDTAITPAQYLISHKPPGVDLPDSVHVLAKALARVK